jgi:hypothetical protein
MYYENTVGFPFRPSVIRQAAVYNMALRRATYKFALRAQAYLRIPLPITLLLLAILVVCTLMVTVRDKKGKDIPL